MKEEYFRWHSPNLGLDIEMLVFGHDGYPVILFPTSMGRYFETKDFGLIESVRWFLEEGKVRLFCIDSVDRYSWYDRSIHPGRKVANHNWYDRMLREELVPSIQEGTGYSQVAVAGCSFGGYHAANFAFRHPEVVSHMFSMSGAFDITSFMHGYYDDMVYFHNPPDYLPGNDNPHLWLMDITLGTSDWDICLQDNERMSEILSQKNIPHWLDVRKWAKHDWPLWKMQFPHYLSKFN